MKKVGRLYKEVMINTIKQNMDQKENTFLLSYSKVSGLQMNNFRKDLRSIKALMHVSKNRLAKIALKDLEFDDLAQKIYAQTAFIFSDVDAAETSKLLVKFAKGCESAVVCGGLLDGKILTQAEVETLSSLPSRDVLLAQLLNVIQSPLTRFAQILNSKTRDLLSILKQLGEQKGGK